MSTILISGPGFIHTPLPVRFGQIPEFNCSNETKGKGNAGPQTPRVLQHGGGPGRAPPATAPRPGREQRQQQPGPQAHAEVEEKGEVIAADKRAERLDGGWRLVTNVGPDAGQSVLHLHFHLLGGRPMGWPPG